MAEREFTYIDASRWKVIAPSRSSLHRLDLVFESLDPPGELLRGEATAGSLEELTDEELCFLLGEVRR
jgi:hypothetical protein